MSDIHHRTGATALSAEKLTEVYLDLRPQLEKLIAHRLGSRAIAAELAQEIFFKIGAITARLPTRADAERFFLRIAMNLATDHARVEARRRELLEESAPLRDGPVPTPEALLQAKEALREIRIALAQLPEQCRMALYLTRHEGLSHSEVAERLGISRSLVEKHVMRALLHCRAHLAKKTGGGPGDA